MGVKLVAADLDGTLLRDDKLASDRTAASVERAIAHGVEVVLATGEMPVEFQGLLQKIPSLRYAVACTGACVLDCRSGEVLASDPLPAPVLRELWMRLRRFDMLFEVFQDGVIWVDGGKAARSAAYMAPSRHPGLPSTRTGKADFDRWLSGMDRPADKVHIFFLDKATRDAAWDAARGLDAYICCADEVDLEIMAAGVDKGTGLRRLAEHLGLRRDEILAVGDSGNDLAMLEYAGLHAVMANGDADLIAGADIVADTNENDGVAQLLDELVAGRLTTEKGVPVLCS